MAVVLGWAGVSLLPGLLGYADTCWLSALEVRWLPFFGGSTGIVSDAHAIGFRRLAVFF